MWVEPGLLRLGDLERLADDLGDDLRIREPRVPLGDRAHHLGDVDVLVGLLVLTLEIRLSGERHQRGAIEERVGDGGDQVGGPRPERPEADARPARQAAVDVRDVGAPLLVANRNELDRRVRQRLVQVEGLLAGDAEDVLDALGLEALDEQFAAVRAIPDTSLGIRA